MSPPLRGGVVRGQGSAGDTRWGPGEVSRSTAPMRSPGKKKNGGGRCRPHWLLPLPLRLARCRLIEALTLRADLMEGRIRYFVALDLRCAVDHAFQLLQHRGIRFAAIGLRAFLLIPQADRDRLVAV